MTMYTVQYEIAIGSAEPVKDTMEVEAVNSVRAKEHAEHLLEEQYNGNGDAILLECEVLFT